LVGLTFRPSDPSTQPTYAILERRRGKIHLIEVGVLNRWEEVFQVLPDGTGRFALNFIYYPQGFYRLPKFRLKLYVDTISEVLRRSEDFGKEVVLIHVASFYRRNGVLPSKNTLAGLHVRFKRLNEYITGLGRFRLVDHGWRIHPSDLLDALATALSLHFVDSGRGTFKEVEGFRIFLPR